MSRPYTFALTGGLDEVTQPLAIKPGRAISCLNHEAVEDGYGRIDGYERYDGRVGPTDYPFWMLPFNSGVLEIEAGDAITGAVSGATGVALADASGVSDGVVAVRGMTGVFVVGEDLVIGGIPHAAASGAASVGAGASGDPYEDAAAAAARTHGRSLILAVPGSGRVRGVVELNGIWYAVRDNLAGTAGVIHKATAGGWAPIELGHAVNFTSGGTIEIIEGNMIVGATSAASAFVRRVVLQSGTWGTGDAAGYFVLSNIMGTFVAENLKVGANANLATIAAAPTANALPPGGHYSFVIHNFYAGSDSRRIYGANGVGPAFEFDGTYFSPIKARPVNDTPERVAEFRNQLFLSFPNGLVQGSAGGEPMSWDSLTAGAFEVGIGSNVVDFISHTDSLLILGENGIFSLTGYDSTDYVLGPITKEAGARPFTAQRLGAGLYLDNRGLRSIETTQRYGNFAMGTITETVKKTMRRKAKAGVQPCASVIVRSKNHYRLFYADGTGISFYVGRKFPEPMLFDLTRPVRCIWSAENDGLERIMFGDDDGFVYEMDKGSSLDGENIQAFVQLSYIHMGSPTVVKRGHKIAIEAVAQAASAMRVSVDYDYSSIEQESSSQTEVFAQGVGGRWDISAWDDFYWSGPDENVLEADIDGQGSSAAILIASDANDIPAYILRGATMYYSERGAKR